MSVHELRFLGLVVQLQHPALQYSSQQLRDVFSRLADIHGFQTFQYIKGGAFLRTDTEGQSDNKSLRVETERITLELGHPSNTFEYICKEIGDIMSTLTLLLKIPGFIFQTYWVRKLAPFPNNADARIFIAHTICQLSEDRFQPFGRPLHLVGLRLFFPQTKESSHQFEVKVESYIQAVNTLFLENHAQFFEPIHTKQPETLLHNVKLTSDFIDQNVISFLDQFSLGGNDKK